MEFSKRKRYSVSELLQNSSDVNWEYVCEHYNFTTEELEKLKDNVRWDILSCKRRFTEDELRRFRDKVDWCWINYDVLVNSSSFIRQFKDYIDFRFFRYLHFSKDLRREFGTDLLGFANYCRVSEADLKEFISKKQWDNISQNFLSEEAIKHCKNLVNWSLISLTRRYTMQFYWDMRDYLDWHVITQTQAVRWKLYAFKRFQKYLDWERIRNWPYIKPDIKEAFKKRLGLKDDTMGSNS